MKRRNRARVALGILAALIAAASLLAVSPWSPPIAFWQIRQPIAFNHNIHVEELGIECVDCHLYATTSVRATIPNVENCADCHEEAQGDSVEEAKLIAYVTAGERVPWRKIYRVPDHVYFSHRRHSSIAAIDCEVCHGPVSQQVKPAARPYWKPTMNNCMECHEELGASNDCVHCHY